MILGMTALRMDDMIYAYEKKRLKDRFNDLL